MVVHRCEINVRAGLIVECFELLSLAKKCLAWCSEKPNNPQGKPAGFTAGLVLVV
jgi:hypothetical protein